jgi:hypothetical protein
MASFKRLKRSDVISVPYVANKNWVFEYCPYPENDQNLVIFKGTNVTGSFNIDYDPVTERQYERLVYSQINHLFYQSFTSSLSTSSLESSLYNDAMTQTRATSSYFNYNDNPLLIKNFPTGAMGGIRVLSINQDVYGQQILPYHFQLSSSAYNIVDDGVGNLYDINVLNNLYANDYATDYYTEYFLVNEAYVGNIFYSHGLAVITNQEYQLMFPVPPLAQYKEVTVFDSTTPKTIDLTGQMAARGNTIDYTSLSLFNYDDELFTDNNDGTVTLNTTELGTYATNYKFDAAVPGSNCADTILTSNDSKIKVNVILNCNFAFNVIENPFPTPTPTPSPSPSPTPSPTPSPSPSPTPTLTPGPTSPPPTPSPSPSPSPTPTLTPGPTPPPATPGPTSNLFTEFTIGINTSNSPTLGFAGPDGTIACNSSGVPGQKVYVAGDEVSLETAAGNGKALYTNSNLLSENIKQGGGFYFKTTLSANAGKSFILGNDGFMTSFNTCGAAPTPTPQPPTSTPPSTTPGPTSTPPPPTSTPAPRYRYERYDIDTNTCMPVGLATLAWSFENVNTGYYSINGLPTSYLIKVTNHTDDTNQLANIVSAPCTPAPTPEPTSPPPTPEPTSSTPETVFCNCGSGCLEYVGSECPSGCTPC